MFAPNSIRSLLSKKSHNQLENLDQSLNNSMLNKSNRETVEESVGLQEILTKHCRDDTEKIINTRILLKEIDHQINDLQKWKEERKKDLETKLAENKKLASLEHANHNLSEKGDESYQKYIEKLQEMMTLYQAGLNETLNQKGNSGKDHEKFMKDIEQQLAEKESKIAELNIQLSSSENRDSTFGKESLKLTSDFERLKESLESWKIDYNDSLRKVRMHEGMSYTSDNDKVLITQNEHQNVKEMIEYEKNNQEKIKRYDFKNDLDDIDNELKELEELLGSK